MSKKELQGRVAAARQRADESRQRAEQEAADEKLLAEYEAQEAAKARKKNLDGLLADYNDANAAYEKQKDRVLADLIPFVESSKAARDLRLRAESARNSLFAAIKPHGFVADPEESVYDLAAPARADVRLAPGVLGDAALKEKIKSLGLDVQAVRGLLLQPGLEA